MGFASGLALAVVGVLFEALRRRRRGDPAASLASILWPAGETVEREALRRASTCAFPAYVAASSVAAAFLGGVGLMGIALGSASAIFGLTAALQRSWLSR
jgi:hypothetical protein